MLLYLKIICLILIFLLYYNFNSIFNINFLRKIKNHKFQLFFLLSFLIINLVFVFFLDEIFVYILIAYLFLIFLWGILLHFIDSHNIYLGVNRAWVMFLMTIFQIILIYKYQDADIFDYVINPFGLEVNVDFYYLLGHLVFVFVFSYSIITILLNIKYYFILHKMNLYDSKLILTSAVKQSHNDLLELKRNTLVNENRYNIINFLLASIILFLFFIYQSNYKDIVFDIEKFDNLLSVYRLVISALIIPLVWKLLNDKETWKKKIKEFQQIDEDFYKLYSDIRNSNIHYNSSIETVNTIEKHYKNFIERKNEYHRLISSEEESQLFKMLEKIRDEITEFDSLSNSNKHIDYIEYFDRLNHIFELVSGYYEYFMKLSKRIDEYQDAKLNEYRNKFHDLNIKE